VKRMGYLAETMQGTFLFGNAVSVADCYLFVMLQWAKKSGIELPRKLIAFHEMMTQRPAVQKAMKHEGLI
jgi:glutathione S-transferase